MFYAIHRPPACPFATNAVWLHAHVVIDQFFAFAKIGHIFRNMPTGLGRIVSKGAHEVEANGVLPVNCRVLRGYAQARIQVLTVHLKRNVPREMVDACAAIAHTLIRHVHVVRKFIGGLHDGLAESHHLQRRGTQRSQHQGRHGIAIVDDQCAWAEFLYIATDSQPGRGGTQIFKNPTRPNRISDALIYTIFQGKRVIGLDVCQPAHLDHVENVIAARQDAAPSGRRLHRPRFPDRLDRLLSNFVRQFQPLGIQVHQGKGARIQPINRQDIRDHPLGKYRAARANERDFHHTFPPLQWESILRCFAKLYPPG